MESLNHLISQSFFTTLGRHVQNRCQIPYVFTKCPCPLYFRALIHVLTCTYFRALSLYVLCGMWALSPSAMSLVVQVAGGPSGSQAPPAPPKGVVITATARGPPPAHSATPFFHDQHAVQVGALLHHIMASVVTNYWNYSNSKVQKALFEFGLHIWSFFMNLLFGFSMHFLKSSIFSIQ